MSDTYGPDGITVLKGLEGVRRRPGMYVGDTMDGTGLVHMLWEVIGNVVDLHLRRDATELHVEIASDGWIAVRDDGPGIPIEIVPRTGASALETVLTETHAGATYDAHYPHVHLTKSLTGVGLSVVNALSSRTEIETTRDGVRWGQAYERGNVVTELRCLGPTTIEGTLVRFRPDPEIFTRVEIDRDRVAERLQQLAWLNPYLRVFFQERRLLARGGLRGWAVQIASTHGPVLARYSACQTLDEVRVDLAFAWTASDATETRCFVNMAETVSGTPVDGIAQGLAAAGEAMKEGRGWEPFGTTLGRGLVAIVHVCLLSPRFRNPSKDHLESPAAGMAVARLVAHDLPISAERDPSLGAFLEARLHGNTKRNAQR